MGDKELNKFYLTDVQPRLDTFIREFVEMSSHSDKMKFYNLNESEKVMMSDALVSALYKNSVEKYKYMDFEEIERSKGDITKMKDFDILNESIDVLYKISERSGQVPQAVLTLSTTLSDLKSNSRNFEIGFLQNIDLITMLYTSVTAALISGTSNIIFGMIEYLSTPGGDIQLVMGSEKLDSKAKILFTNMERFNRSVDNGELNKLFENTIKKNDFLGMSAVASISVTGILMIAGAIAFVPISRELIYFFYDIRMKISEYFKQQSIFLELNASTIDTGKKENKNVQKKQQALAKKLMKISDTFKVKYKTAERKAESDINKKVDIDKLDTSQTDLYGGSTNGNNNEILI